jgi:uncharacterized protein (TIGR03000 family)
MYSLVLVATLTAGGESPALFPHYPTPFLPVYVSPAPSSFYGFHTYTYGGTAMAGTGFGSCYGCCGGGGCLGGLGIITGTLGHPLPQGGLNPCPIASPGVPVLPAVTPTGPEKLPLPPEEKKEKGAIATPGAARVVVALPADAHLFVNGQPTKSTSDLRTFQTPELEAGETYSYLLRAEVLVDGRSQTQTKRILLRRGEEVRASFDDPRTVVTARER